MFMGETRCRRCGADFPAHDAEVVCPYCGSEPGSRFAAALVFVGRHWVLLTIAILAVIFVRPSPEAWTWIGAAAILAALALGWSVLSRARRKSTDEIANLDLGLSPPVSSRPATSSIALSPPKVPQRWRALVDSRPPRDVYMWAKVWTSFLAETFSVIVIIYANFAGAHRHHETP